MTGGLDQVRTSHHNQKPRRSGAAGKTSTQEKVLFYVKQHIISPCGQSRTNTWGMLIVLGDIFSGSLGSLAGGL